MTALSELRSQGQQFYSISWEYPGDLQQGDTGQKVRHLQYMLSVLSEFIPQVQPITVDGIFGPATRDAVIGAQRYLGLPATGIVDDLTWDRIYDQFSGIETRTLRSETAFPDAAQAAVPAFARSRNLPSSAPNANSPLRPAPGQTGRNRYSQTTNLPQFPGRDLQQGSQDTIRQEVVR